MRLMAPLKTIFLSDAALLLFLQSSVTTSLNCTYRMRRTLQSNKNPNFLWYPEALILVATSA